MSDGDCKNLSAQRLFYLDDITAYCNTLYVQEGFKKVNYLNIANIYICHHSLDDCESYDDFLEVATTSFLVFNTVAKNIF